MTTFITVIHVITCILLILVVMLQSGKGAEISASLGGSSQTVFGSSGGANFFTRFTSVAAAIFMVTSLTLTIMGGQSSESIFGTPATAPAADPATPPTPAATGAAESAAVPQSAGAPQDAAAPVTGTEAKQAPAAPAAE